MVMCGCDMFLAEISSLFWNFFFLLKSGFKTFLYLKEVKQVKHTNTNTLKGWSPVG